MLKRSLIIGIGLAAAVLFLGTCQGPQQETDAQEETNATEERDYLRDGQVIAGATFSELSGLLQSYLRLKGVEGAIEYCQVAALPLTDSLSEVHAAQIKRVGTRVRNPQNKATEAEAAVMAQYQELLEKGERLESMVQEVAGRPVFYAPIRLLPLCEQCHGVLGEGLAEENYELIKAAYPEDEAIGYRNGDLRGIWSITFQE